MARKQNGRLGMGCQPQGAHMECLRTMKSALEVLKQASEGGGWRGLIPDK